MGSRGTNKIKFQLITDQTGPISYYRDGSIFVTREAANDPKLVYRAYLHHILYSKSGVTYTGPERNVLESGVADYLVASYAGSPKIYQKSSMPINLEEAKNIRPAVGTGDRYLVGLSWALLFFHLRQAIGPESIDKAVLNAWFEMQKDAPADRAFPTNMISKLLERVAPAPNSPNRAVFLKIVQQHGAPIPARPSGT